MIEVKCIGGECNGLSVKIEPQPTYYEVVDPRDRTRRDFYILEVGPTAHAWYQKKPPNGGGGSSARLRPLLVSGSYEHGQRLQGVSFGAGATTVPSPVPPASVLSARDRLTAAPPAPCAPVVRGPRVARRTDSRSKKESPRALSASDIAPGSSRTVASTTTRAAASPPLNTKSPTEISSVAR